MSIAFRVQRHSGDYIKTTVIPGNRSSQARFGTLDGVIIALFLGAVVALFYLLGQS